MDALATESSESPSTLSMPNVLNEVAEYPSLEGYISHELPDHCLGYRQLPMSQQSSPPHNNIHLYAARDSPAKGHIK